MSRTTDFANLQPTVVQGLESLDATKVVELDSANRLTIPSQPSWCVESVRSGGETPTSNGSFDQGWSSTSPGLHINNVTLSGSLVGGTISATVPASGKYLVMAKRHAFTNASSQWTEFRFLVNGTTIISGHHGHVSGAYEVQTTSAILELQANDYVSFGDGGGVPFQLHGQTNFSGFLLG